MSQITPRVLRAFAEAAGVELTEQQEKLALAVLNTPGPLAPAPIPPAPAPGLPCSDCCHKPFRPASPRPPLPGRQVLPAWECTGCGKTAVEAGGYHHQSEECAA